MGVKADEIPKLRETPSEHVKWRLQSGNTKSGWGRCVAYIDAMDAMDQLDNVIGADNWYDTYYLLGQRWMCGITVVIEDGGAITKWDTGDESKSEGSKGQVSDSFKRAARKWGVGRDVQRMPLELVRVRDSNRRDQRGSPKPELYDENGKTVYDETKFVKEGQHKKVMGKPQGGANQENTVQAPKEFDVYKSDAQAAYVENKLNKGMTAQGVYDQLREQGLVVPDRSWDWLVQKENELDIARGGS
jgi:hypothetical protein